MRTPYRAVRTARSLAARAVRQIIDRFLRGSVRELVAGMVEAKVLKKDDIEELERFVTRPAVREASDGTFISGVYGSSFLLISAHGNTAAHHAGQGRGSEHRVWTVDDGY